MTALTDALAHANIRRVFLAEITAGQHLVFWTLNSGSTWYASTTLNVVGVEENGVALTARASIALVDANPGSYFHDSVTDRVYVHCTAGASPYDKTLQAQVKFYFANHPKIFNDIYYEPRLLSVPALSLRVERKFTGVGQIAGGSLTLDNHDGFFDDLVDLQWDAGLAAVYFGADRPGLSTMAFGDYGLIGSWRMSNWNKTNEKFTLTLLERKSSILKKIPTTVYSRADYPNLRESDKGKYVPLAYGTVKDVTPVCINVSTRRFKVAGHAITGFDAVRVKNESTGAWDVKGFATVDLANGEFTMSGSDWVDGNEIAVDFRGKPNGSVVMDNASDVVKDILTVVLGEPSANLNASSFTAAKNRLDGGVVFNSVNRATIGQLGVYVDDAVEARAVIETINLAVGVYLISDANGTFYYRVFDPVVGEGLPELTEKDITAFSEDTKCDAIYSRVIIRYAERHTLEWFETYKYDISERRYLHDQAEPALLEKDAVVSSTSDAKILGQRLGLQESRPARSWKITAFGRLLLTKLPGDFLHLIYPRHGLDVIVEIVEISHDLMADRSTLVVSDGHGFGDSSGFWVDGAAVLPTRFAALAGYGAGSLNWNDSWDDEIKTWVRQNIGYWTDANGFASSSDPASYKPSTWS